MNSYLYLISEGAAGPVKVGVSVHPDYRCKTLQTGNPRPLRVVATYQFVGADAFDVEQTFFVDFGMNALGGEWFDYSESLIVECMPDFFESNGFQVAA